MRRQPLALLFLALGIGVGLFLPYAGQTVMAVFSSAESRYTANIYQDVIPGTGQTGGLTTTDVLNTGRDMPQLVAVVPPRGSITPVKFEALRDHHAVELRFLRLGRGTTAWDLGPLAHGQMATLRMWWTAAGSYLTGVEPVFYAQIPHLNKPDLTVTIWRD